MYPDSRKSGVYDLHVGKFEGGLHQSLGQDSFNFITLKGQGAFGKVYKVRPKARSPARRRGRCTR